MQARAALLRCMRKLHTGNNFQSPRSRREDRRTVSGNPPRDAGKGEKRGIFVAASPASWACWNGGRHAAPLGPSALESWSLAAVVTRSMTLDLTQIAAHPRLSCDRVLTCFSGSRVGGRICVNGSVRCPHGVGPTYLLDFGASLPVQRARCAAEKWLFQLQRFEVVS